MFEIFEFVIKDHKEKLKKFDRADVAPWRKRKEFETLWTVTDPYISRDLSVLKVCSPDSVFKYHTMFVDYFHNVYGLSEEIAETWMIYFVTKNIGMFQHGGQIDGLKFFDDRDETATPAEDPELSYKALRLNIDSGRPYVNLHIGASATKSDVKWFIDHYWEQEVANKVKPRAFKGRITSQSLRRFVAAYLREQGIPLKDIRNFIEEQFSDEKALDDSNLRKPLRHPKYKEDIFFEARNYLGKDLRKTIQGGDEVFDIEIDKKNFNHIVLLKQNK